MFRCAFHLHIYIVLIYLNIPKHTVFAFFVTKARTDSDRFFFAILCADTIYSYEYRKLFIFYVFPQVTIVIHVIISSSPFKAIFHLATLIARCEAKTRIRQRDWLKLNGEKIRRERVGSVPTFLSVRANKFAKWKIGFNVKFVGNAFLRGAICEKQYTPNQVLTEICRPMSIWARTKKNGIRTIVWHLGLDVP